MQNVLKNFMMNKELKVVILITLTAVILSGLLTIVVVKFELLDVKEPLQFWAESGKTIYIFLILGFILDLVLKIKTKIKHYE